jgi:hypothetical protein
VSWDFRLAIIVPAAAKAVAETAARAINSTGPNYEGDAFTIALSATGSAPTTHYALYTSATDEMVAAMAESLPNVSGAMFWRHGVDGSLVASNVSGADGQHWGWSQSMAAAGLQQILPPSPYA